MQIFHLVRWVRDDAYFVFSYIQELKWVLNILVKIRVHWKWDRDQNVV